MHPKMCPVPQFVELFETIGATKMAQQLGASERAVYNRRPDIEREIGRKLIPPSQRENREFVPSFHPERHHFSISSGIIIVGSDQHYWPDVITTAHRGFVKFIKDLQPKAVYLNGDIFDGARISRHAPIGWETKPSVIQEIETCKERLAEIEDASPRKAVKVWALGNHDARFESRLASVAPEYARVQGVHLKDHFPFWEPCWGGWINADEYGVPNTVIKHRYKGGEHAAHNNTIRAGTSFVTGHDHTGKVTPFTDYRGTRYGVSLPTMADPYGPQFVDYTEDNPRNHRSGFAVLTFHKGRLLQPQLALVLDGKIDFQGKIHEV
jgi:hypothetical protein